MRRSHYVLMKTRRAHTKTEADYRASPRARLRFASGEKDWSQLSRAYGASRETIKNAVLGFTFKELPMPPKRVWADRPFPYA
jgi:hypothetical protein